MKAIQNFLSRSLYTGSLGTLKGFPYRNGDPWKPQIGNSLVPEKISYLPKFLSQS